MKPLDYPLLADENIHPEVIRALAASGKDIRSVHDEGLVASAAACVLQRLGLKSQSVQQLQRCHP